MNPKIAQQRMSRLLCFEPDLYCQANSFSMEEITKSCIKRLDFFLYLSKIKGKGKL
jgi:hypothetical protein